ncbi:MAG: FAD-dependent oxidoreductase [Alphaproteobacteria bacterium]|nr:FAD-dependent oxidoreductase [Alphaproteobacteria bacterium]
MQSLDRRAFLTMISAAGGAALLSVPKARAGGPKARVVVVGGGFGGATAARYLRLLDPSIQVTLIEREKVYTSCPLSNEVISGVRDMATLQTGYDRLAARGVAVVHDEVTAIDPVAKAVTTAGGARLDYDALIVSPGIRFDFSTIAGLTPELSDTRLPHAWKAGPQTALLRSQLEAMPDGGRFVIVVPKGPFRCPPGPYERAAQVAMYCQHHGKSRAKVLILDSNETFSKRGLFEQAWKELYGYGPGGMIEWMPVSANGPVSEVIPDTLTCKTDFEDFTGDVVNIIPPHRAAPIAAEAGLTNASGWCPVKPETMESTLHKDIHVIGDACVGGDVAGGNPFPKSAHMANSQAKVVAASLVARFDGRAAPEPIYTNTCYSVVAHDWGFSVVHLYRVDGGQWVYVKQGSGISPVTFGTPADPKPVPRVYRKMEAEYADGWLRNLMADSFG